jgi:hypothetical protein
MVVNGEVHYTAIDGAQNHWTQGDRDRTKQCLFIA